METMEAIMSRRSVRKWQDKEVPREVLEKVIEAGRFAPSGMNMQKTHFLVVRKKETLDALAKLVEKEFAAMEDNPVTHKNFFGAIRQSKRGGYVFHYNPPALVITCNQKGHGNALPDTSCALENMFLAATDMGLGTCWINQLYWLQKNKNIIAFLHDLGMKDDEESFGSMSIGYPPEGLPARKPAPRKGNEVTWVD